MEGFTESERRGLLGKVISILDNGIDMTSYEIKPYDDGLDYYPSDIKKAITNLFTKSEFVMIINKINQCNPNTFINHSFQNEGNCVKLYNYLQLWRTKYWNGEDMSDFLCGMIGNIRRKQDKAATSAISHVSDKTNYDVSRYMESYVRGGLKRKKRTKKRGKRMRTNRHKIASKKNHRRNKKSLLR